MVIINNMLSVEVLQVFLAALPNYFSLLNEYSLVFLVALFLSLLQKLHNALNWKFQLVSS